MKNKLLPLVLLVSIFLLNDFLFIGIRSYQGWLLVDYGSRLLAIGAIAWLIRAGKNSPADFGFRKISPAPFAFWTIALSVSGVLIDRSAGAYLQKLLPPTALAHYPVIHNSVIKALDLSIGLALVSVSEEAVFRGYFFTVVRDRIPDRAILVALSCVVFGLIHWSSGLAAVLVTAAWGVLPMVSVMKTGSILPAVIAHYVTDFVFFLS